MKKLILSLVFVFALGIIPSLNASNNLVVEGTYVDCIALAYSVNDDTEGGISYAVFDSIVSNCEQQQQQ